MIFHLVILGLDPRNQVYVSKANTYLNNDLGPGVKPQDDKEKNIRYTHAGGYLLPRRDK